MPAEKQFRRNDLQRNGREEHDHDCRAAVVAPGVAAALVALLPAAAEVAAGGDCPQQAHQEPEHADHIAPDAQPNHRLRENGGLT